MVRIDIYSDTVCPWCVIGKRRLERALATREGLEVSIKWHGFQLNPDMPAEGMSRAHYLASKFGAPDRAASVYAIIERAGHLERIPFDFESIECMPNTVQSHRLIRYADREGKQEALVEALFKAFFLDGEDIGNDETLKRIAVTQGLERDAVAHFLAGDEDRDTVMAEDIRARRMGISAIPCYIVNGDYAISGAQEPEAFYPLLDLANIAVAAE
ncbi:MAG: dithiol-disulfide isomerase [Alphaproteobacteria bacterium]|nr:dithiol-disulfide isomerase [Alphaproteobacteria bacterium]